MRGTSPLLVVVCTCLVALSIFAFAGQLSPPGGAVTPTMHTLDEISGQISSIQVAAGGAPIKRVVRGVIDYTTNDQELSQNFSPAVDPSKSVVLLSDMCATSFNTSSGGVVGRTSTCLMNLTSTQITIRIDGAGSLMTSKVSYQIIEYN